MRKFFLVALLLLVPVAASAQVTNPSTVQFTASPDQNTIENSVNILTSYEVRLYTPTGTIPVKIADIGKPTPDASNVITWASLNTLYNTVAAGNYVVRVAAKGPGGSNETPSSDPFTVAVRAPAASTNKPIIK